MARILVTRRIPPVGIDNLSRQFDVDLWTQDCPIPRSVLLERVSDCDGLLCMLSDTIDADVMNAAGDRLKVISNYAVGFNNIDLHEAKRRGIVVGNTPDVLTDATADLAISLLLSAARRLSEAEQFVRNGQWSSWSPLLFMGQELRNKTMGIFGMGRIGQALAQRCHGGWGMEIIYTSRTAKPQAERLFQAERVSFQDLLTRSDFVSVHAPLTPDTHGLFGEDAFSLMKESAIFINTARGSIHDQTALHSALATSQIFAAGLDVTHPEPMSKSDPLLKLSNCIVTPHIGSATQFSRHEMARLAVKNIHAGIHGVPLPYPVELTSQ